MGIGLEVIDIDSGSTTEILHSRIGYPSEGIPPPLVWLLGDVLYWECVCDTSSIQRTPLSSLVAEDVASRPVSYMVASPDGVSIAYVTYDQDSTARLFAENPDGSGKMQLAVQQPKLSGVGASMPFAWRPSPAR